MAVTHQIPLVGTASARTSHTYLRAELDLYLWTLRNTWLRCPFLVDSGTPVTIVSAAWAKQEGLPLPLNPVARLEVRQYSGQPVRDGFLRVQVVQRDGLEYYFPCFFVGDPDAAAGRPQPTPRQPQRLLGLTGVIDKVHLHLDDTPSLGAPHGNLIVAKT
jgi:hypothetical protein